MKSRASPIALPDEYLAKEFFEQRICSLHRDAVLGNNRRLQSISPMARDARRHASRTRRIKGEKNVQDEKDNFDYCRLGADCPVHDPVRRRCLRASGPGSPPGVRNRSIPPQQCLCRTCLRSAVVGLQLRRWNVGSGRALIDSQDQRKGLVAGDQPFPAAWLPQNGCRRATIVAGPQHSVNI
jgi:hypothetical protein